MSDPILISEVNLSYAWAKAFLSIKKSSDISPSMLVTVSEFEDGQPLEDEQIRDALNSELTSRGKYPIDVSALVVFPYKVWIRRGRPPCKEFSNWCLEKFIPRLKARDRNNRRGLYFERMMGFRFYDEQNRLHSRNQLAYIIDWWKKETQQNGRRPRRSGLQVACFDPRLDQIERQYLVFPCLQQIGFTYDKNGLIINAFYPTQFILDRAYGNYLGLCHLGMFMAYELNIKLSRMNCFVSCSQLGNNLNKGDFKDLSNLLKQRIHPKEK